MVEAADVVARANAVAATYVRGRVEGGVRYSSGESKRKWTALGRRLQRWAEGFAGLTPPERALHRKALGTWTEQRVIDAVWTLEALGMLLWAVRLRPLRAWDRAFAPDVLPYVDTPSWFNESGPATKGRPLPRLQNEAAIEEMLDRAEAWHWRAVTAQRRFDARTRAIVADAAHEGERRKWFRCRDDDFPYRGKAYAALSEDARETAASIALERHRALVWLTSAGERWDRVDIGT